MREEEKRRKWKNGKGWREWSNLKREREMKGRKST